jgi:hypothetical protein
LNLVSRGGNPGFNYLGIVRPQLRAQQQIGLLQQQLRQTNQALQDLGGAAPGADPGFARTGHPAVFNNTGPYFSTNPAFGAGGWSGAGRSSVVQVPPFGGGPRSSAGAGPGRPAVGPAPGGRR